MYYVWYLYGISHIHLLDTFSHGLTNCSRNNKIFKRLQEDVECFHIRAAQSILYKDRFSYAIFPHALHTTMSLRVQ